MRPVAITPPPADFDATVRTPGLQAMAQAGIDIDQPLPSGTKLEPHWKKCLPELRHAFDQRCCFTGSYMRQSEVIPVEHALPKNLHPNLAYEWSNFRYASSRQNSRKGTHYLLDPACLPRTLDVYHLEFSTGAIFLNPAVERGYPALAAAAAETIEQLGLDEALYRQERMEVWDDYLDSSVRGQPEAARLQKANNFVWYEAQRQQLL